MASAAQDTRAFIQRETAETRAVEALFAQRLQRAWKCELRKLGKTYSPDFLATRNGKGVAWVELKCRFGQDWAQYPTYMVAVKKWEKCLALAETPNISLPWLLAVAVDNGDYWLNARDLQDVDLQVSMGGRTDRNWAEDQEPCVFIPKKYFRKLPDGI